MNKLDGTDIVYIVFMVCMFGSLTAMSIWGH